MVRKLKFHEQKLLKKVDFIQWKTDNPNEAQVLRRYHIQKREDYVKYSKICGMITKIINLVALLKPDDPFRQRIGQQLLDKLYDCGLVAHKLSLSQLEKVTVSALCRRRLSATLVRLKMSGSLAEATRYIEQGHIRVGPETVRDPSFFIVRNMEDMVTWVDQSKIKRKIAVYNDKLDDYDLMQ